MIGHLQSNKARNLLSIPNLEVLESLDSTKLAKKLNDLCEEKKRKLKVYIEVLTSPVPSIRYFKHSNIAKYGVPLANVSELLNFILTECKNLEICGLMTMPELHDKSAYKVI